MLPFSLPGFTIDAVHTRDGKLLVEATAVRTSVACPDCQQLSARIHSWYIRDAELLATWLQAHPDVEIVSRDRSTEFARGSTNGAPAAVQVADRWHLLVNLREALERVLDRR